MQTRALGKTGLELTPIGFGAWAIGGQWGRPEDGESVAAIRRGLELGVNWIDTAPGYGCGHSEEVVGRAIRGLAERPIISTKCGFVWEGDHGPLDVCLKADSVRREIDASLRRLGVDVIDMYQIHWREPDEDIEEAWSTLADLKAQGKVRFVGASNFDVAQMERCARIAPMDFIQPPYSMLLRTPLWTTPFEESTPRESIEAEILPYCARHEMGVVIYSPMGSGLLSGRMTEERIAAFGEDDWRHGDPDFHPPLVTRTLALVERLRPIADRHGCTVGALAIAWALSNPTVSAAIVGLRRPEQAEELVGAGSIGLDAADLAEIDEALSAA